MVEYQFVFLYISLPSYTTNSIVVACLIMYICQFLRNGKLQMYKEQIDLVHSDLNL